MSDSNQIKRIRELDNQVNTHIEQIDKKKIPENKKKKEKKAILLSYFAECEKLLKKGTTIKEFAIISRYINAWESYFKIEFGIHPDISIEFTPNETDILHGIVKKNLEKKPKMSDNLPKETIFKIKFTQRIHFIAPPILIIFLFLKIIFFLLFYLFNIDFFYIQFIFSNWPVYIIVFIISVITTYFFFYFSHEKYRIEQYNKILIEIFYFASKLIFNLIFLYVMLSKLALRSTIHFFYLVSAVTGNIVIPYLINEIHLTTYLPIEDLQFRFKRKFSILEKILYACLIFFIILKGRGNEDLLVPE